METEPLFEVTSAAATAAARRLTTAAKVQAVALAGATTDTTLIESMIDRASALAAGYCGLARDAIGTFPTFGRETCRATWWAAGCAARPPLLLLPWRVPIVSITSVVEDGETLAPGDDYALQPAGMLQRLNDGAPVCWSAAKIVVTYVTGWNIPTADVVPPDVEAAIIDQVKTMYLGRDRDGALRSETVFDVHQASYSAGGGSDIGESGLLVTVEGALAPYKNWAAG
ncbi:hypothetical protein UFOVP860_11 [uncultured Caudovirales phage]|uniref:Gp6 domain containing protein n=1 Tax=uncultured Caudovirales phage TaxID=2100421 RepID=A0A6J5T5R9_9CAUD|nr:hypothetical protein UFOVP860_11 [uncultured Caudovirales phage]CAB4195202.1 hypothetical protein UFOVP1293_4 [uncultured Caudovirales phage]CAB4222371.1 hypothetical protein UFOVP1644_22 [uncultured Caudovirales phage]